LLVVGLGNPGAEFERTRHNLGAEAVELVARRHGERMRDEKGTRAIVARVDHDGRVIVLAVPLTYVNESGLAVGALARRYGIDDARRIVIVHDELDLPSARVKVKLGGGSGGHNGLESVSSHLHDSSYARVRIGIGKPPGRQEGADYVLRRPGRAERETLDVAAELAADAIEVVASSGVEAAMQKFNTEPVT
jgi:peptidyl-tRNA hydrolase, PTH1 family